MTTTAGPDEGIQDDLYLAWARLLTPHTTAPSADVAATGTALITSWADPTRRYHDLTHLQHVLAGVEQLADHATILAAVRLAAWYHDAVYEGRPDDEARSADRAERELTALGLSRVLVDEVARLVRLTATHDPAPDDANGHVLCDADLAILASPTQDYARYTVAVRAEYAHVPDDQFRTGRAAVLRALLDGPTLFGTPEGRARWETPARVNLTTELAALTE